MHSGNGVLNVLDPDEGRIHKLESRSEEKSEVLSDKKIKKYRQQIKNTR